MCWVGQAVGADAAASPPAPRVRSRRSPCRRRGAGSVPSLRPRLVSSATSGRKSDSKKTRSKAMPRPGERLALAGDHPGARLRPEFQRLLVAGEDPHASARRRCRCGVELAGDRVLGAVVAAAAVRRGRLDVVGVAGADEVVALLAAVGPRPAAGGRSRPRRPSPRPCCGRRRRSGCGARPGRRPASARAAIALPSARLRRWPMCSALVELASQKLTRVAPPGGEVGERRRRPRRGSSAGAGALDPGVGEAQPRLLALAVDRRDPGLGLDPLQRRHRLRVLAPARGTRGTSIRSNSARGR